MFSTGLGDEPCESSYEECTDSCNCSDQEEAYLDQLAVKDYEEDAKKKMKSQADKEEYLEYTLKGINVPIRMRKSTEIVPVERDEEAEMAAENPFPPSIVETVATDPVIATALGTQTMISASDEAIAILKEHKRSKKSRQRSRKSGSGGHYTTSGTITPHMRPPPPTPPEHATLPHTVSTPHLPVFHHYTDELLLEQYQIERAKDRAAFDLQTSKIKQYLLNAKIERGGVGHLKESEYSVDLASREDAMKVQHMGAQRRRGMIETEPPAAICLSSVQRPETEKPSNFPLELPKDFNFGIHVTKYTTSGFMRHQHQRTVREDENGTKTILKTWIEITQEINVPSAERLSWEDVKTAVKDAKAAKAEAKKTKKAEVKKPDTDRDKDKENGSEVANEAKTSPNDAELLLDAAARIKAVAPLTKGVALGQYLSLVRNDINQESKGETEDTSEADDSE